MYTSFPSFVQTREVSIGTASLLISADPLVIEVTITPSRGLVWDATGDRFEASTLTTEGSLGESITMTLPCTDVVGWRDSVTGALIDVSAPGSYTHTYAGTIRFLDSTKHSIGKSVTLGRFVLPVGDGSPVDLDKLLPVPGVSGGSVLVPDSWSALVADAVAAAASIGNADLIVSGTIDDARLPVTARAATLAATYASKHGTAVYDIRDYGAKVDGIVLSDAAMTAGSAALTSAARPFTAQDVGKAVGVSGAGYVSADYTTNANDGVLISTIASVSGGVATLAAVAVNTVSAATACFGTPDDDAFAAAQNDAAPVHGTVYIPPGRTIVTRSLALIGPVSASWGGAGRETSWVEVIMSGGANPEDRDWLYKAAPYPWLEGVYLHDFAVEARYHIRPSGYVADLKPLNFWGMKRPMVERMQCSNFPATALPFDACRDGVVIRDNLIVNPGRLCPPSIVSGGSGIGIGVSRTDYRYDYIVEGNSIIGVGSKEGVHPKGNNGIFVEAQDGPDGDPAPSGFRIIGNFVQGMTCGIADNGAAQMIIAHNTILDCFAGIDVAKGGVALSYAGDSTLIQGNVIRGWALKTGLTSYGIRVAVAGVRDFGGARILDNIIVNRLGWGIRVDAPGDRSVSVKGVEIRGNRLKDITLTGIRIGVPSAAGLCADLAIIGNDLDNCGSSNTSSDNTGIRLEMEVTNLTLTGNRVSDSFGSGLAILNAVTTGQITGNDVGTFGGAGVIAAGVRVFGNLGWAASIPAITGSRSANAALSSLLTQLAAAGIVTNSTTI